MKTDFEDLFDDLPISLLQQNPIVCDDADDQTVERVLAKTRQRIAERRTVQPTKRCFYKRVWFVPAVAILLVAVVVTAMALSSYWFVPSYPLPIPYAAQEGRHPLLTAYEEAVSVGVTAEQNGLQVTLESYAVDTVDSTIYVCLRAEATDGSALSELTGERMSIPAWSGFEHVTLVRNGINSRQLSVIRTDDASDPTTAMFQLEYKPMGADKELTGTEYVLKLRDLYDTVRVTEDLGFAYESMQMLYEDMQAECDFEKSGHIDDGQLQSYVFLDDSGQRVRFSTRLSGVYIDNIGIVGEREDLVSGLYVSYKGLGEADPKPQLMDMRSGETVFAEVIEGARNRTTVCYKGVTLDDLPHLFMLLGEENEKVVRVEGTWDLAFTVKEDDAIPVYTFDTEEIFEYNDHTMYAQTWTLSDIGLYVKGTVTTADTAFENDILYDRHTSVTLKDGTVLSSLLQDGGWNTDTLLDGEFEYGANFRTFINCEDVVSITLFGNTFEVDWSKARRE